MGAQAMERGGRGATTVAGSEGRPSSMLFGHRGRPRSTRMGASAGERVRRQGAQRRSLSHGPLSRADGAQKAEKPASGTGRERRE